MQVSTRCFLIPCASKPASRFQHRLSRFPPPPDSCVPGTYSRKICSEEPVLAGKVTCGVRNRISGQSWPSNTAATDGSVHRAKPEFKVWQRNAAQTSWRLAAKDFVPSVSNAWLHWDGSRRSLELRTFLPNQTRQRPFYSFDGRGVGAFASNCPIAGSRCRPIRGALHTWHSLSECETSTIISISTHEPNGICVAPKAVRACAPRSPKTSKRSSEAPLATSCGSVKPGALFTSTSSLTICLTLFRSPRAACSVATSSMATSRPACLPSAVVICCPSLPENGLPSFFASRPDR